MVRLTNSNFLVYNSVFSISISGTTTISDNAMVMKLPTKKRLSIKNSARLINATSTMPSQNQKKVFLVLAYELKIV